MRQAQGELLLPNTGEEAKSDAAASCGAKTQTMNPCSDRVETVSRRHAQRATEVVVVEGGVLVVVVVGRSKELERACLKEEEDVVCCVCVDGRRGGGEEEGCGGVCE